MKGITRRDMLKSLGVTAGVIGALGCGSATAKKAENITNNAKRNERTKMPEPLKTDVLVVGAGSSGVPAAIAAARAGAKTLLIEDDQYIGGAPTDMFVSMFCGGPFAGVTSELNQRLRKRTNLEVHSPFFLPEVFMREEHLMLQEAGATVMTGARVTDVTMKGDALTGVIVSRGLLPPIAVESKVAIDATGTGAGDVRTRIESRLRRTACAG